MGGCDGTGRDTGSLQRSGYFGRGTACHPGGQIRHADAQNGEACDVVQVDHDPAVVRGLVDAITLVLENGRLRIEVRGELAAILRMARGSQRYRKAPEATPTLWRGQIKLVAGTGFEPVTFRL